ncbi:papain-like cysteine protease family protein [Paenibacillus sonchi]|uniref:papain-like cysteine protease family protein n=1 Tax=Paenibacillus sonchi TaxID=373687 RepID=UPI001E374234|nr:papain-like cysteine protease family protein [Paenibacillus sonchi]MCE3200676.1 C39 family peptidase [Paenibacillus sonchi]
MSIMRKIKKSSFTFILAITATLMVSSSVSAYVSYITLSVPVVKQEQTNWCWVASSVGVIDFLGTPPTQNDFVNYVKGGVVNQAGTVADVKQGLQHWNVSSTTGSSLSFQTVANQTSNNQPIISGIIWKSGGGHMYTIRGYYEDTNSSKQDLYYIDPWPGNSNYNIMSYSNFLNNSSFFWNESVYNIYVS